MQFLEWPDFGVPQGTDNMLQFCQQMREKVTTKKDLIVIHCRYFFKIYLKKYYKKYCVENKISKTRTSS